MKLKIYQLLTLCSITLLITACSSTTLAPLGNGYPIQAAKRNQIAAGYNVQLGLGYLQQGDVHRAKQKLLLALKQAPNWAITQDAMAYFMESTGNTQTAEKYYQKALSLDANAGTVQNNYGAFLCRLKRYQEADQYFLKAAQNINYINTAQAYENAGLCALQIPDLTKAADYFEKAVMQDPKRAMSWLELGEINFNQKNYTQSQQYLNQYMQLTADPIPEALWLGVRLAKQANDNETAGRYTLMLQDKYPNSTEYKQLLILQAQEKAAQKKSGGWLHPIQFEKPSY